MVYWDASHPIHRLIWTFQTSGKLMYSTMVRTIGSSERSELDIDSTTTNGIMKKVGNDVGIFEKRSGGGGDDD